MSAEGEAIRSNDYRKDTTVKAPSTRPAAVLGLDVGKSSHWACLWIGNIYLDDSGRDSPASLNSTGDM